MYFLIPRDRKLDEEMSCRLLIACNAKCTSAKKEVAIPGDQIMATLLLFQNPPKIH